MRVCIFTWTCIWYAQMSTLTWNEEVRKRNDEVSVVVYTTEYLHNLYPPSPPPPQTYTLPPPTSSNLHPPSPHLLKPTPSPSPTSSNLYPPPPPPTYTLPPPPPTYTLPPPHLLQPIPSLPPPPTYTLPPPTTSSNLMITPSSKSKLNKQSLLTYMYMYVKVKGSV